jgi:hypothetical protein
MHRITFEREATMRTTASFATALAIAVLTCAPAAAAQRADSAIVGSWSGQASISVPWTIQRTLPVKLNITGEAGVTGTIGDAPLLDAHVSLDSKIARALHLGRKWAVDGRLGGALIQAEGIRRDRVHISLDRQGQTLIGDLQTSGSYEGGPSELVLTANDLVLHRAATPVARVSERNARPATVAASVPSPR